jgi:sec-independent protein translocase protein TatA
MPNLKGWEWLIIIALILLLFGAKRLPDAARGLGRSLRIFKAETKGLVEDGKADGATPAVSSGTTESLPPAPPASPGGSTSADTSADPVRTERADG